jgi:hypothetical protein
MGSMPRGRPTALDELASKRFREAVARGLPRRHAAALAGVTYQCVKGWMQRGRKGIEPYAAFVALLEKADAEAVDAAVRRVRAGEPGWQGSAWWLERRHPRLFPRQWAPTAPESTGMGKGLEEMTDAELLALAACSKSRAS